MPPIDRVFAVHLAHMVGRSVGTTDPDVLAVHERLVAAHVATRRFLLEAGEDKKWGWREIALEVDRLVDQAQSLIEALR